MQQEKIIKRGINDVDITVSSTLTDINGVEFEVWGSESTYGQDRIDRELFAAQKNLAAANALDKNAYKQRLIDNAQAAVDRLQRIQTELDL